MQRNKERPKPVVVPELCKGCGRCVDACPKHCFAVGSNINSLSGLIPIEVDLEKCNGCGLCFNVCPEPFALEQQIGEILESHDHIPSGLKMFDSELPPAEDIPDTILPLPKTKPLVIKGTYASAIGALLAGCRHFFGYPITPSTEGAELMAKLLPELDGVFIQAVSEIAAVNMMYGCSGAGLRCMTFTSSPGLSLMLEGISYMIGAEVPGVFVSIMRGGPGLGNVGPEQSDIKLACRGLGHGNTHAITLAPASPQEMLDLTILAFELSFKYRNPVMVMGDGYLGQITGKVQLPDHMVKPGIPQWAVYGDRAHRRNLICSIKLQESDLEAHNIHLNQKYQQMSDTEQRAELFCCDDAEVLLIAANTPSRAAKGAVQALREEGIRAGLFRPISLWPFPIDLLMPVLENVKQIVMVEASNGQLEDEVRLALSHKGISEIPFEHVRRFGGILPQQDEVVEKVVQIKSGNFQTV